MSTTTVIRWSLRYRAVLASGRRPMARDMVDVSSRAHQSLARTHRRIERKVVHLRVKRCLGPVQIAGRVQIPASTVHRIVVRAGLNRLDHLDRAAGEIVRRYEREHPGDLIHVDLKKFGRIPTGGGWKVHGPGFDTSRASGNANALDPARRGTDKTGYACVHSALDDHSRLTYAKVHDDETTATVLGFWERAVAFFADQGITVTEVLTDNGPAYRSRN